MAITDRENVWAGDPHGNAIRRGIPPAMAGRPPHWPSRPGPPLFCGPWRCYLAGV